MSDAGSPEKNRRLIVRQLGLTDYEPIWRAMQSFTDSRQQDTPDELWLLSHRPVFTQGQAGKAEHLLAPGQIPVIQIDRGGQVTYHGPGQLVVYLLIDVRRAGIGVRELVSIIEQAIVDTLAGVKISAQPRAGAPGVYVGDAKIASLGLRIRRGCSYHGMSLNVAMNMEPFNRINPCGYQGLQVTQAIDHTPGVDAESLMESLEKQVLQNLILQLGPYSWIDVRQEL
jgi:lipoyl(octanoyl) transferase